MKKLLVFASALLLCQTLLFAQNGKSVSEKDVPERYVKDFHRMEGNQNKVEWKLIDTLVYDVCFVNEKGTETAYRFSPKGTETRWYIKEDVYPHSLLDKLQELHPGYKVKELYALQLKNKVTYQALVGQRKGLFVKKWKKMHLMNFEIDGKYIDEIEL